MTVEQEKRIKLNNLLIEVMGDIVSIYRYFDLDSNKMIDEKIRVFTELKNGKKPKDIDGFYDVFELMPKTQYEW